MSDPAPTPARLAHFPVSFFSMIMGLTGLGLAWLKAQELLGMNLRLGQAIIGLASLLYASLLVLYLTKWLRHRNAVHEELGHPVKLHFFPTLSISLLLLAVAWFGLIPGIGGVLWVCGTCLQLLLSLYVMNAWLHQDRFQVQHLNPAWFIPVVGNMAVPLAGVPLGFVETSWWFFSIGLLLWPLLFSIVLYRILFHPPLPDKLLPTLFILIAPPAVGFLAYTQLTGAVDAFARILYDGSLFLTLLLVTQSSRFVKLAFTLSWWAYAFPLAAVTLASLRLYQHTPSSPLAGLSLTLLGALTLMVVGLLYRTARAVQHGAICRPEP